MIIVALLKPQLSKLKPLQYPTQTLWILFRGFLVSVASKVFQ